MDWFDSNATAGALFEEAVPRGDGAEVISRAPDLPAPRAFPRFRELQRALEALRSTPPSAAEDWSDL